MCDAFRNKRIAGLLERPVLSKLWFFSVVGKAKSVFLCAFSERSEDK